MYKFLIRVESTGKNYIHDVNVVENLFKTALQKTTDKIELKKIMMEKLTSMFSGRGVLIWLDLMDRSYYLNVYVQGRKNMVISATYVSFDSLRDVALYNMARMNINVGELEIPGVLKKDIKKVSDHLEYTKFENVERRRHKLAMGFSRQINVGSVD